MESFKDYSRILEELRKMDTAGCYIVFEETIEIDKRITQKFVDSLQDTGNKEWFENDELLAEYAAFNSSAGFINGFIRAMYIMYKATEAQEEAKAI